MYLILELEAGMASHCSQRYSIMYPEVNALAKVSSLAAGNPKFFSLETLQNTSFLVTVC
jgi:hypothetical protein